jgi:hypothetical protein
LRGKINSWVQEAKDFESISMLKNSFFFFQKQIFFLKINLNQLDLSKATNRDEARQESVSPQTRQALGIENLYRLPCDYLNLLISEIVYTQF